jgi:hypothetical protein
MDGAYLSSNTVWKILEPIYIKLCSRGYKKWSDCQQRDTTVNIGGLEKKAKR